MPVQTIPAAHSGMNSLASPESVPRDQAPRLENLLADRDGATPLRGPWQHDTALPTNAATFTVAGCWAWDKRAIVSYTSSPHRADRFAHLPRDTGGSAVRLMDEVGDGSPAAVTAAEAALVPWRRATSMGDLTLGYAAAGPTGYTVKGGDTTYYPGKLLQWTPGSPPAAVATAAPLGGADVAAYAQRLWVAGGVPPLNTGGHAASYEPNALFFSEPGTAADWTDDVTNLVNRIDVDPSSVDNLTGLAAIDGALLVFKRAAVYRLTGSGLSTFAIRRVTSGLGCVDAHSILPFDDGAYFLAAAGFIWHNGYEATSVSEAITPDLRPALHDMLTNGGRATTTRIGQDHIMLAIVDAASRPTFCGLYNRRRGSWTMLSSSAMTAGVVGGNPLFLFTTAENAYALARAAGVTTYSVWSARYLLDVRSDWATSSLIRGYDLGDAGRLYPIPAKWWSRAVELASPERRAHVRRVMVDYDWRSDQPEGWFVNVVTGDGRPLGGEFRLSAVPASSARGRVQRDVFGEARDVSVRVEWRGPELHAGAPVNAADAALYKIAVEYDATHQ